MKYRNELPQIRDGIFLTDGGLETELCFIDGMDLPEFSAIYLMRNSEGYDHLARYYRKYLNMAVEFDRPFILESPTWRASQGWSDGIGCSPEDLDTYNREAISMLLKLRYEFENGHPIVISGCVGPRSDGYAPATMMSKNEAQLYHQRQVNVLASAGADYVSAVTMSYPEEAIGIARAAAEVDLHSVISFTVETDGRLITGETLEDAIYKVDTNTERAPAYYMINCAHPTHFESVLTGDSWTKRIKGIRANASKCSHEELDNAAELDDGDPVELSQDYARLMQQLPWVTVLGGCCGTDIRHISAIAETL